MSDYEPPKASESVEVPGVGEFMARPGSSIHELAGAAKYWSDKAKTASAEGFALGLRRGASIACIALGTLALIAGGILHFVWK